LKDILIAIDEAGYHTLNHLIWKYIFLYTNITIAKMKLSA